MNRSPSQIEGPGDFIDLLHRSGYAWPRSLDNLGPVDVSKLLQGTTVLAFHFNKGVMVAGPGIARPFEQVDEIARACYF